MIYVISDLHGYPFDKFQQLLGKAGFSGRDFMFILGDVIDRGVDSVQYLQWLVLQPNVQLVLGNHEAMMLSCSFLFDEINEENIDNITSRQMDMFMNWKHNGAKWTLEGLYNLEPEERRDLIEYLQEAPLYETVSVGGKDFLLTHSGIGNFEASKKLQDYEAHDFLWNRPEITDRYYDDIITVFGHTPTFLYGKEHYGKILKTDTWIDIDVGAGYDFAPVLLRLDDMAEFTV